VWLLCAGAGGVEQDYDAAYKYLSAAADGGDRDAQFYLGAMYLNVGRDVLLHV
jgi:TPR repeat protein